MSLGTDRHQLRCLVIGAGEIGSAFVEAFRAEFPTAYIVATHVRADAPPIAGADETVYGVDVTKRGWHRALLKGRGTFDWAVYTPAFGAVGCSLADVTPEQKRAALVVSYKPLLQLERTGKVRNIIATSAFLQLRLLKAMYGAMLYPKRRIVAWNKRKPCLSVTRRLLRSALFDSRSSKQIMACLLLLRNSPEAFRRQVVAMFGRVVDAHEVKQLFIKRLCAAEYRVARYALKRFSAQGVLPPEQRLTTRDDIVRAARRLFNSPPGSVVNVVNQSIWVEPDGSAHISS